jgi:hypothetical protein
MNWCATQATRNLLKSEGGERPNHASNLKVDFVKVLIVFFYLGPIL